MVKYIKDQENGGLTINKLSMIIMYLNVIYLRNLCQLVLYLDTPSRDSDILNFRFKMIMMMISVRHAADRKKNTGAIHMCGMIYY